MVFQERYLQNSPAWLCQNSDCGYRHFLRPLPTTAELIRASKGIQASARRSAMKAGAHTQRAKRQIAWTGQSLTQKKRKTGS
jgi:hypothetical protein